MTHVWAFSMPHHVVLGTGHPIANVLSELAVGVTLFFTLSGFLLYRPFAASIARGARHMPVRAYLRNRLLRIAPAYWVILLFVALVLGTAQVRSASGALGIGRLTDPFSLLQTGLLLQDYRPSKMVIGIGPAWSLAVEAVFYCVLPLLVLAAASLAARARDRRGRVILLLAPPLLLLLLGLSGKVAAHLLPGAPTSGYNEDWHSVIERSFWAQADLFSFGMVVAVLHAEMRDHTLSLPRLWRPVAVVLGLLVFLPCAVTMNQGEQSYLVQNTGEALGIALLFSAVVLPDSSASRPFRFVALLETRPLVAVGVASYSLFLWHLPVIFWLRSHGLMFNGGWPTLIGNLMIALSVAGGLSALTYRFVERPALRLKRSTRTAGTAIGVPQAGAARTVVPVEARTVAVDPALRRPRA
jgi:peptidoglycan/LPS O-acetylase OafA/YrhL